MANTIISEPNDYVAIICTRHDNNNNTYIINPIEVSLGRILDDDTFETEDGTKILPSIDSYDSITNDSLNEFYAYPISLYELKEKYDGIDNINLLLLKYFKEIASNISIALKTDDEIRIYGQKYEVISPEITGDISKKYNKDAIISNDYASKSSIIVPKKTIVKNDGFINNLEMEKYLKERIFENDDILEDICTTIAMNFMAKDPRDVEAILSVGPTGSGKTETFKLIAEYLNTPITIYDSNTLTAEGYVGKSIEDSLKMVLTNCGGDPEKAKKGLLIYDEIDKLADKGSTVGDIEVQNALLKVLDGHSFDVEMGSGLNARTIKFDTSFLTIVGLGAFPGLFEAKKPPKHLGFGEREETVLESKEITTDDFVKFGMLAELMGRFHNVYFYHELDKDALKRILLYSKNSPLLRKVNRLKNEFNTELTWSDEFVDTLIEYAYMKKAGGRSLNKLVSNVFKRVDRELLFEMINNDQKSHKLVLTKDTIENNKSFKM